MENKLAKWICRRLRLEQVVDDEYEEVYVYGLELIVSFLISTSIIMTIGLLINQFLPTLTFLITFVLIRQFTGGYHATSYLMCKICTITCFGVTVLLANIISIPNYVFIILAALGCLVIFLFGPIENIHKPLTRQDKKRNKITGFCLFAIWSLIGFLTSYWTHTIRISNTIFFTLFVIIILMIIPLLERRTHHEKAC